MSKGSKPRPFSVDRETFSDNWDAIFSKKNQEIQKEIESIRNMKDKRTEGEKQTDAWLKNEYYEGF